MGRTGWLLATAFFAVLCSMGSAGLAAEEAKCVECHSKITPNVVKDWKESKHSNLGVGCDTCHGSEHSSAQDAARAWIPTLETCAKCHDQQASQFKKGKHAIA